MLCAAVIRSRARLDYAGVAAALGGDLRGSRSRYREHLQHLHRMVDCAVRLRKRREARGALDFNLEQAQVVLDEDDPRRVRDVRRSRATPEVKQAYGIVEDYMLAANEAVAAFFRERKLDTIWRVHDKPDEARIEEFAALAESYGIVVRPEQAAAPRALRGVILSLAGRPMERALSFMLLRSLKQATYDVVNIGHFGLASSDYLHFTSPIRRYPDLVVHRLLKRQLHLEGLPSGGLRHAPAPSRAQLETLAAEASAHERRAMEAEREVVDMYRAYLMRDRLGEELAGTVSAVTSFGLFVAVDEPFVEGLVRLAAIGGDFWEFDEDRLRLFGRRSGRAFALGDEVRVRVESVSVARRRIELALVAGGSDSATSRRVGEPGRRRRARSPDGGVARTQEGRRERRPGRRGGGRADRGRGKHDGQERDRRGRRRHDD
jgi:ribonuclease R